MQPPRAEITIAGRLLDVIGHESSMSQAISNLLGNAIKFVPEDTVPKIRIRTHASDGGVLLTIQDNGIGIQPEYKHRLFGTFERVHADRNTKGLELDLPSCGARWNAWAAGWVWNPTVLTEAGFGFNCSLPELRSSPKRSLLLIEDSDDDVF